MSAPITWATTLISSGSSTIFPVLFGPRQRSVRIGLHAWTVFDPIWADKASASQ
ncbi:MAG: hypothetical protein IPM76_23215 [Chloroflexi bacterium]|nr:hypothetical protein [Chloroflexota bacterium]